jgi:hypothetical protein
MKRETREHFYRGVRLGLGLVAGILTLAVLVYGVNKLRYPEVDNSLFTFLKGYPPRLVGGISVAVALAVLVGTLDRWAKMLPGLFAYAAFGGILAVFGGGLHSSITSLQLNRLGAAAMAALFGVCALLTMGLGRHNLSLIDRAAALTAPLLLMWAASSNNIATAFEALAALVVILAAVGAYDYMRDRARKRDSMNGGKRGQTERVR